MSKCQDQARSGEPGSIQHGMAGQGCGDGDGPRPSQDVGLQVGPAQHGLWLGRAGLWQWWRQHPTASLGQGLRASGAGMGSWAMGRVGGTPRVGRGIRALRALALFFFPRPLLFRNPCFFGTPASSQAHQPLVFPVLMVYMQKHSTSCNRGCVPCLVTNWRTPTCHFSLVQMLS